MEIIWKPIPNYEGYEVNNIGEVRSYRGQGGHTRTTPKVLKTRLKGAKRRQYISYALCIDGKRKNMLAHRLVAKAFIPNHKNKPQVNHIDNNPLNNKLENLEWCTPRENALHWMSFFNNKSIGKNKSNKLRVTYTLSGKQRYRVDYYEQNGNGKRKSKTTEKLCEIVKFKKSIKTLNNAPN